MLLLFQDKGGILDDETIQLKSCLLSMGVSEPVTRDAYRSGDKYFKELAKELYFVLVKPIKVKNKNMFESYVLLNLIS